MAEYDGAEVEAHEALERLAALFGVKALQIRALDSADKLQPLGVEVVVEARELQRRAVHVGGAHAHGLEVFGCVQYGEILFLSHLSQAHGILVVHSGASFPVPWHLCRLGGTKTCLCILYPPGAVLGNVFCSARNLPSCEILLAFTCA